MAHRLLVMVLLVALVLVSCGRIGAPGGSPIPGPTPTVTPTGHGDPAGPDFRGGELPTEGPVVTG
ncbi:MAG TPA: hypothetical protein VHL78_11355 [Actinomycetota bacterium]|nr:hypothetical protein [Actinomycetota bacterium]